MVCLGIDFQRSVLLTYGPKKFFFLFPGEEAEDKGYNAADLKKLRQEFNKFMRACQNALNLHRQHVADSQPEYHENLQRGFDEFKSVILPLLQRHQQRGRPTSSQRTSTMSLGSAHSHSLPPGASQDVSEV